MRIPVVPTLVAFLSMLGFAYLLGVFVAADFDITRWEPLARARVAFMGFWLAAATAMIVARYWTPGE